MEAIQQLINRHPLPWSHSYYHTPPNGIGLGEESGERITDANGAEVCQLDIVNAFNAQALDKKPQA